MKKLILSIAFLSLLAGGARAGIILGTSNPPGTPLLMSPGTTSGPMFVNVVSDNPPNDIMAAWNFKLEIIPDSGASGTLTFQDPATGTAPIPPNYVFGSKEPRRNKMSKLQLFLFHESGIRSVCRMPLKSNGFDASSRHCSLSWTSACAVNGRQRKRTRLVGVALVV